MKIFRDFKGVAKMATPKKHPKTRRHNNLSKIYKIIILILTHKNYKGVSNRYPLKLFLVFPILNYRKFINIFNIISFKTVKLSIKKYNKRKISNKLKKVKINKENLK